MQRELVVAGQTFRRGRKLISEKIASQKCSIIFFVCVKIKGPRKNHITEMYFFFSINNVNWILIVQISLPL